MQVVIFRFAITPHPPSSLSHTPISVTHKNKKKKEKKMNE
jgi:hypothetical protein